MVSLYSICTKSCFCSVICCLSVTGIMLQLELNLSLSSSRRRAGPSRCTPRVLQPANVRLLFFPLLTGRFYGPVTVGTAAFSSIAYNIRTQATLVFSAHSWVIFSVPFALASRDTDWPSWSSLLASCSLHAFSWGSVMCPNGLASKLESSVLQMVSSLIRKSLMSAKSHVGARVCSSVV